MLFREQNLAHGEEVVANAETTCLLLLSDANANKCFPDSRTSTYAFSDACSCYELLPDRLAQSTNTLSFLEQVPFLRTRMPTASFQQSNTNTNVRMTGPSIPFPSFRV